MGRIEKLESDLEQTRAIAEDLRGWQEGILSRLDALEKGSPKEEELILMRHDRDGWIASWQRVCAELAAVKRERDEARALLEKMKEGEK